MTDADQVSLEYIGTATMLLRLGPFTVLTDPNFLHAGQRAYLGKGLFSKRLLDSALTVDELPALDLVLLSHLHGDHFDRVARRSLDRSVPLLTTPSAASRLRRFGFEHSRGLSTWGQDEMTDGEWSLRITAAPALHAPGRARHLLPPVMGSVLELHRSGILRYRMYVSGDTLFRPWLSEVIERTGPLDAAVLHLGGTRILGMLVTMDDQQGADLVELLRPEVTVPVHHSDYRVFRSPLADFVTTWNQRGLPGALREVGRGDRIVLSGA